MTVLTESFTLANNIQIPKLGFGTWQIPNGDAAYDAVAAALAAGYRHIDTARAYGNEASVGKAIADSGIAREELFVTTKLPAEIKEYAKAVASFEESIAALALDYVDLYLIHAPWPWSDAGSDHREGNIEAWRSMEEHFESGRSRSIGVSNFEVADLESLRASTKVTPHVNQIKFHVGNTQPEVTEYCQREGILVEGYSPLATGGILDNADLAPIAEKYGVSVAQLCIRYLLEKDVLPLPKSTTPSRMAENAEVDFDIAPDDMAQLDELQDATA